MLGITGVEVRLNDGEIDIGDVTGAVDLRGNRLDVALDNVDGPISVPPIGARSSFGSRPVTESAPTSVDQGDVVCGAGGLGRQREGG